MNLGSDSRNPPALGGIDGMGVSLRPAVRGPGPSQPGCTRLENTMFSQCSRSVEGPSPPNLAKLASASTGPLGQQWGTCRLRRDSAFTLVEPLWVTNLDSEPAPGYEKSFSSSDRPRLVYRVVSDENLGLPCQGEVRSYDGFLGCTRSYVYLV